MPLADWIRKKKEQDSRQVSNTCQETWTDDFLTVGPCSHEYPRAKRRNEERLHSQVLITHALSDWVDIAAIG